MEFVRGRANKIVLVLVNFIIGGCEMLLSLSNFIEGNSIFQLILIIIAIYILLKVVKGVIKLGFAILVIGVIAYLVINYLS